MTKTIVTTIVIGVLMLAWMALAYANGPAAQDAVAVLMPILTFLMGQRMAVK